MNTNLIRSIGYNYATFTLTAYYDINDYDGTIGDFIHYLNSNNEGFEISIYGIYSFGKISDLTTALGVGSQFLSMIGIAVSFVPGGQIPGLVIGIISIIAGALSFAYNTNGIIDILDHAIIVSSYTYAKGTI